jgi:hypothetical protein
MHASPPLTTYSHLVGWHYSYSVTGDIQEKSHRQNLYEKVKSGATERTPSLMTSVPIIYHALFYHNPLDIPETSPHAIRSNDTAWDEGQSGSTPVQTIPQ